jgi:glycosyltransferase involved in cell wall biosynthesis
MINILHSITDLSNSSGGPTNFLSELLNELYLNNNMYVNNKIFTTYSKDDSKNFLISPIYNKSYFKKIYFVKNIFKNHFLDKPTIIHHHGLWQYPMVSSYLYSKKRNLPFILSPHGMLEPWSLKQNKTLKKIAGLIYQDDIIRNSKFIHATSIMEAINIKNLGFNNKIAVIPNGINTSIYNVNKPKNYIYDTKNILFLSRIHEKKGIELLIEAFSFLDYNLIDNYNIQIIGQGERDYIKFLNKLIKSKGLVHKIIISEPVYGDQKIKLLQDAYILILPSYSENFGNVIAESISCGTPVITTNKTPWEILNKTNSGWCIDIGVDPLFKCLDDVLRLDNITFDMISKNARNLALNNFDIKITANMHLNMYLNIFDISNNNKLDYVY